MGYMSVNQRGRVGVARGRPSQHDLDAGTWRAGVAHAPRWQRGGAGAGVSDDEPDIHVPASESHHTVRDGNTTRRSDGHAPLQLAHRRCSSNAFFCPSDAAAAGAAA